MEAKFSLAILGVMTVVSLFSESADAEKMVMFKEPFFSSDIKNSKTFKDQCTVNVDEYPAAYSKSFNGSRYKFVGSHQGLDRLAAQSDCQKDSAHLVFIDTKEENDFLVKQLPPGTNYWIGLFSPKRNLFWDNGHPVTFVNVDRGNADTFNDKTSCYKMSNNDGRHWLDKPCEEELGFICEYEGPGCSCDVTGFFNNSCYNFVNDPPATHASAQLHCKNTSSHLVFIESKEENDFLMRKVHQGTEYWIGMSDRPQLFWDDGKQVTFANIDENRSNTFNRRSGCYRMSNKPGKRVWVDRSCEISFPYICEYTGGTRPSGFNTSHNDSYYKFVNSSGQETSRFEAQSDCETDSSHLVFIETKDENDFLDKTLKHNDKYWIGLFSPERHLSWDNNHPVTFVNMDPRNNETFNDKTGCYKMSSTERRYWVDASCKEEIGYICESNGSGCSYNTTGSFNVSCYKFVNDLPASRFSARLKCENESSHLVYVDSKEEHEFLLERARNGSEYWIGLHDRPQLFWDDGKEVSYTNVDAEKDFIFDGRTGCYKMSKRPGTDGLWFDRNCRNTSGYICEYEG